MEGLTLGVKGPRREGPILRSTRAQMRNEGCLDPIWGVGTHSPSSARVRPGPHPSIWSKERTTSILNGCLGPPLRVSLHLLTGHTVRAAAAVPACLPHARHHTDTAAAAARGHQSDGGHNEGKPI
ncbi:hypothetical protein SKAU_G00397340 [Synaphobranchus kaupii]|uniref:Uncharacterized protein n=1 Tax=Synaphobranchus kaupii TaxID=118154 RepID=A0A9Q1IB83_SYNKA|nr:hypothetical protein SKAU_G00397340 [Synaphobranchus kaupii]